MTINPTANFVDGRNYAIRIDATAIEDGNGNVFEGINDDTTWSFTIIDNTPPVVSTLSPANGATNMRTTANLIITFDENITIGTGLIAIRNLSDGTQATIDVTNSAQVSASGSTLTISPASPLIAGKNYAVQIADTAVDDTAGNSFSGIGNDLVWAFSTVAPLGNGVIIFNDFETGTLQNWTATGSDAGLYQNGAVVGNMLAADAGTNFAPNGQFSMWDGRSGSALVLTEALPLAASGYTSVTIAFNYKFRNGSGTRRLYTAYTPDNGTSWIDLGYVTYNGSKSYTLTPGSHPFTDQAKFRFAFADSGGAAGPAFIDDVMISVEGGVVAGSPFGDWADTYPYLTDGNPALDFDGGSLPTGIEWVLGGDPSDGSDDADLAPSIDNTTDPDGKLLFEFRRSDGAGDDANTTIVVQYGSDLAGWTTAVHQGSGPNDITLTEIPNGFEPGIDKVTVALPPGLTTSGKLFARLKVVVTEE